jgi:hypothetical protein
MRMRWSRLVGRMRELRNASKILVGKLEGKTHILRTVCKREIYFKMEVTTVIRGNVDRIYLAQNGILWQSLMNTVLKVWVPQNTAKFFTSFRKHLRITPLQGNRPTYVFIAINCATHFDKRQANNVQLLTYFVTMSMREE